MATAFSAASLEENDIVYFECPVCMGEINDTWKLLPCQHVFCFECLRKIYQRTPRPQRPRCPTCRDTIYTPLKFLRKPRLLFDLYEKSRADQEKKRTATDFDDTSGDLSLAIKLQEIEDEKWRKKQEEVYNETDDESWDEDDEEERNLVTAAKLLSLGDERRKEKEIAAEKERVEIALSKSRDEVSLREKEIATEKEHVEIALCKSRDEISLREKMESFFSIEEKDFAAAMELSIQENANLLNVKDFNNHLTGRNSLVLDTILTMIANEEALKSLESSELVLYLEHVERYLQALERYRNNQIDKIVQDFGECSLNFERGSSLKNTGDSDNKKGDASSKSKDNDLIGLIRQLELERNEDAILKVVLKNSEMVDPIDTLHRQFMEIKKKLADVLASKP